ncbi:hypothetical protein EMCRGX_G025746 [Ephydatia muelleri]
MQRIELQDVRWHLNYMVVKLWPGALLSGGAARAPDHNCQGEVSQSTRRSVIYFAVATLAKVFPQVLQSAVQPLHLLQRP